jgi:hypothetical protein
VPVLVIVTPYRQTRIGQFKIILNDWGLQVPMTEKKGLLEKIFGKQDSGCGGGCCCGPKIVPKTDAQQKPDEKKESQE